MRIGSAGDNGHDSRNPQLRAFLDGPFHAVEFEDCQSQHNLGGGGSGQFLAEVEFNPLVGNGRDPSSPHRGSGRDIKFLPDAGAKNANEMIGMLPGQSGTIPGDFVGNPSTAGHELKAMLGRKKPDSTGSIYKDYPKLPFTLPN